jgi:hypothetical protein
MRIGDTVMYVAPPGGSAQPARVTEVLGSGPSGYKLLHLELENGDNPLAVPHVRDPQAGEFGYWCSNQAEVKPVAQAPKRTSAKAHTMKTSATESTTANEVAASEEKDDDE